MAEPQPPNVQEGDQAPESVPGASVPAGAEDRKAAAAMDKLDARGDENDNDSAPKKEQDTKALGDAMQKLDVGGKGETSKEAKEEEKKRVVKVDPADVTLLVCDCKRAKSQRYRHMITDTKLGRTIGSIKAQSDRTPQGSRCRRRKGHDCMGHCFGIGRTTRPQKETTVYKFWYLR